MKTPISKTTDAVTSIIIKGYIFMPSNTISFNFHMRCYLYKLVYINISFNLERCSDEASRPAL